MSARLKPGVKYILIILFAIGVGALLKCLNASGVNEENMYTIDKAYEDVKELVGLGSSSSPEKAPVTQEK